jgi:hypothetical protein
MLPIGCGSRTSTDFFRVAARFSHRVARAALTGCAFINVTMERNLLA